MRAILVLLIFIGQGAFAAEENASMKSTSWTSFHKEVLFQEKKDERDGLSYVLSGSLALAGGLAGSGITNDAVELGIYGVFQTIGIASIGFGAYTWAVGGEERILHQTLLDTRLTTDQKNQFLQSYSRQRAARQRRERLIKILTHGLIAALNIYNGSEQKQDGLKTTLYFIGGVNLLATVSYAVDF